jgi:hypothetical protein
MAKIAEVVPAGNLALSAALRKELRTSDVLWMPNTIIANTKLTPGAKFLYSVLLNQSWKGPIVCPSHKALAQEIGASVRATRNYIDELTHAKLITLQPRPGKPSLYAIARH